MPIKVKGKKKPKSKKKTNKPGAFMTGSGGLGKATRAINKRRQYLKDL